MTYVITTACVETKDASCLEVCPVDCIHPTPDEDDFATVDQLFIDPQECIDCDACAEVCPVEACVPDHSLPDGQDEAPKTNASYYGQ